METIEQLQSRIKQLEAENKSLSLLVELYKSDVKEWAEKRRRYEKWPVVFLWGWISFHWRVIRGKVTGDKRYSYFTPLGALKKPPHI